MTQAQNFKNAFKCQKCPGNNGPNGCPMWWETMWKDGEEIKQVASCGYAQLPMFLMDASRGANHAASSFDKLNNTMSHYLTQLCSAVKVSLEAMQEIGTEKARRSQGELIDGR